MAQAKLVTVVIDENGDFSVDLTGFHGKGCAEVSKVFDDLGKTTTHKRKREFAETCSREKLKQ